MYGNGSGSFLCTDHKGESCHHIYNEMRIRTTVLGKKNPKKFENNKVKHHVSH